MKSIDDELALVCQREYPRLVGLLALHVGDRHIAEELAQDALAQLCRRWERVERPSAWLTRVALNLGASWTRRKIAERRAYHRHGLTAHGASPPDAADAVAVRAAVARLPSRQRTALVLRYYEDLSVAETAEIMGCAEGTVKALTHRAIRRLRSAGGVTGEEAISHA